MARRLLAVVFDLDGTLSRPGAIDFLRLRARLAMPPSHPDILEWVKTQPAERHAALLRVVEEEEEAGLAKLQLNAGAAELFNYLAARRPRLHSGVLTRNNASAMRRSLQQLGLLGGGALHEFDVLISRDCAAPKPSPAGLLRMAGGWGIDAGALAMVGDAPDDMQAALAAGAIAVAIGDDEAAAELAHHRISHLGELVPLLAELEEARA